MVLGVADSKCSKGYGINPINCVILAKVFYSYLGNPRKLGFLLQVEHASSSREYRFSLVWLSTILKCKTPSGGF